MDLQTFFETFHTSQQKLYEALRALYVDRLTEEQILKKFGISLDYLKKSKRNALQTLEKGEVPFFLVNKPGPKRRRTSDRILEYE